MSDIKRTGISRITIENFKGIGEKVTIPLKPITLLFGANSAGKSTVLQALLYAHEVLNNRNPDADVTEFGGEKINLGGFRNLVHGHDLGKEIKIGFEYTLDDDGLPLYGSYRTSIENVVDGLRYSDSIFNQVKTAEVNFTVQFDKKTSTAFVRSYSVGINSSDVAKIRAEDSRSHAVLCMISCDKLVNLDGGIIDSEKIFSLSRRNLSDLSEMLINTLKETPISEKSSIEDFPAFIGGLTTMMDDICAIGTLEGTALPKWGEMLPFYDDGGELLDDSTCSVISSMVAGPGELIAKELEQMRYIGPIRAMPPRNYVPQRTVGKGRWADGMAGWDVLLNDITAGNKWFDASAYERLELGYEFVPCLEMAIPSDEVGQLAEVALKDLIPKMIGKNTVRMRDIENRTSVEPCDVGTGVSQVIPVIAGAMAPGCRFLSVEQPELHLHPAIQCKLGDLFISQAKRYPERTFLLETHSEHLILRLLRRIRETSENKQEDTSLTLTPDDVGVLYVEEIEKGVRIRELRIGPNGQFLDEWPGGFFEEDFDEIAGGL